jgi:hypothetical protein
MFASGTRRDDRGSMPVAMLVTMVAMSLSAGLAVLVTGQLNNSRAEADRVAAVSAAQAGLDAALARIRTSVQDLSKNDRTGVLSKLPCDEATAGTIPKSGSGVSSAPTYSTTYAFFLVNPATTIGTLLPVGDLRNVSKLINKPSDIAAFPGVTDTTALTATLNSAVPCDPLTGVLEQVPLYALLRSVATVGKITRTLYATYQVRTTEEALDGGHILVQGTGGKLCVGASPDDLALPRIPTPMYVYAVPCTGAVNTVTFIYPKNLSLSLVKTRTNYDAPQPFPFGLCITSPALPKDQDPVTFTACQAARTNTQMFSYDVNAQTYYAPFSQNGNSNNTVVNTGTPGTAGNGGNFCLSADTGVQPPRMVLRTSNAYCGSAGRANASFVPEATVGAGGAGVGSQQFVNFAEVGRCLDLTNEIPIASQNSAKGLITYPCKQSFTGTPYWNHRWFSPTVPPCSKLLKPDCPASATAESNSGPIYTVPDRGQWNNQKFCMESPGAAGGYVWVLACSPADPAQVWTIYGASSDSAKAYRVLDMYGNCLMAGASLGYTFSGWSYVITTPCDGKDQQKWNAPRSFKVNALSGIQEK